MSSDPMIVKRFTEYGTFLTFAEEFMLRNEPCIFDEGITREWTARTLWQKEGSPNLDYLAKEFGAAVVPVADCTQSKFSSHPKYEMKFEDYVKYWKSIAAGRQEGVPSKLLYLKDWHFTRDNPGHEAYLLPDFFHSDWLNELWDLRQDTLDDYRFVYVGPKDTWTPFHADVFRSYSWSANVCGRKEWLLYPPGEEVNLRDNLGNLPFDVTSPELNDRKKYPNAGKVKGPIRVIQEAGEVIFVASGWFHQVKNLEDTISINHNWMNSFSLHHMWNHLKEELKLVQLEIADCRDMEGWEEQCQVILRASAGMDYKEFFQFLCLIALPRLQEFEHLTGEICPLESATQCFTGLKAALSRAMSCKSFTFFGKSPLEEQTRLVEPKGQNQQLEGSCPLLQLTARDNLQMILKQSLEKKPNSHTSLLHNLSLTLPDTVKDVLQRLSSCKNQEYLLLVTFRAYELHRIWTVMQELSNCVEFTAVSSGVL